MPVLKTTTEQTRLIVLGWQDYIAPELLHLFSCSTVGQVSKLERHRTLGVAFRRKVYIERGVVGQSAATGCRPAGVGRRRSQQAPRSTEYGPA